MAKQNKPSVSARLRSVENDLILIKNWINGVGADTSRLAMATDRALEAYATYQGEVDDFQVYLEEQRDEKAKEREAGQEKQAKGSGTTKTSRKPSKKV